MAPTPTPADDECPPPADVTPDDDTNFSDEPEGPPTGWLASLTHDTQPAAGTYQAGVED